MSFYVEWVNQIKARATTEWLTDAQREAHDSILNRWKAHRFVCLCGPPGSGKSFVARLLAKRSDYVYTHGLEQTQPGARQVIVDDAAYSRMMRVTAHRLGIRRVVIVMRRPPRDPMPKAEVKLTQRDVRQFRQNLHANGILPAFRTPMTGTDLGRILRREAVERGQPYVAERP